MEKDRYRTDGHPEAEFEPRSRGRVLANLQGISSVRGIQVCESTALLALTATLLRECAADQSIRSVDICDWHWRWLGAIYRWAGNYRSLNLSKGGFPFAAAAQVPRLMERFERDVLARHSPLRPASLQEHASALAAVHGELILIHPFRDGNGRLVRLLCTVLAAQAGLPPLDYSPMGGRYRRRYIGAIHAYAGGDPEPLAVAFSRVIERSLSGVAP